MYCSKEKWNELTKPLKRIDPIIQEFATSINASVSKDYHNNPSRAIRWGSPINRLIQIYLDDENDLKYTVWICASEDRGLDRFWKNKLLYQKVEFDIIETQLSKILNDAYYLVTSWTAADLEFAIRMKN